MVSFPQASPPKPWAVYMGKLKNESAVFSRNFKKIRYGEKLVVDEKTVLNGSHRKTVKGWTGCNWFSIAYDGSVAIETGNFLAGFSRKSLAFEVN
jgi:hypothetical protein